MNIHEYQAKQVLKKYGVPVLGAAVGGIPDFIEEGVNGLLFRGNDREDLRRVLLSVLAEPERLFELRRGVRPPRSMRAHAADLVEVYEGLLAAGRDQLH